jgi:hypothetical protein
MNTYTWHNIISTNYYKEDAAILDKTGQAKIYNKNTEIITSFLYKVDVWGGGGLKFNNNSICI